MAADWSAGLRPGIKFGKDAFHRVPSSAGKVRDAVERVPTRFRRTNHDCFLTSALIVCLLLLVESAFAQTLTFPPRNPNAPDGKVFSKNISALGFAEREQDVFSQVTAGNVPEFLRRLCPVTVTNIAEGTTNVATFFVDRKAHV